MRHLSRGPRRWPGRLPIRLLAQGTTALVLLAAPGCGPDGSEEAEGPGSARPGSGPSLVVVIVADQLRADLLERYDPHFTAGLRRLRDGGLRFVNATHDHAETATGPGHGTLATGRHPSGHGLTGNEWWERTPAGWREVYAVEDTTSPILGVPESEGRSPRNLRVTGLADWLREAHPDARVVSLSRKDRAAIPLAGRVRGEVYWLDEDAGRFVTSEYYRSSYPNWLLRFHRDRWPGLFADSVWESTVPAGIEGATRPDPHPHEGDGVHTTLPHRAMEEVAPAEAGEPTLGGLSLGDYRDWIADHPVLDEALLLLAREAVAALELGRGDRLDYLGLGLSQTDAVGHDYGPLSREQLDNLLRLDRALGAFMEFLDRELGPGGWLLAFSADHGVSDLPEWLREQDVDAGRVGWNAGPVWRAALAAADGVQDPREAARRVADTVRSFPEVREVRFTEEVLAEAPADSFGVLFRNGLFPGRHPNLERFGVLVRARPHWVGDRDGLGTTHGSPYHYDRWVPLVFYGPGVEPGVRTERVSVADMAPTLAALLGLPVPDGLDGRALRLGDPP